MEKIKMNTNWDLTHLLKTENEADLLAELKQVKDESYKFINKWKERTDYLSDAAVLKEALDEYEAWAKNYGSSGRQGYYFDLKDSLDQSDPKIKAKTNKISDFARDIINNIQFFELSLAKIDESKKDGFLKTGILKDYRHFLYYRLLA